MRFLVVALALAGADAGLTQMMSKRGDSKLKSFNNNGPGSARLGKKAAVSQDEYEYEYYDDEEKVRY